jgi:hypothetical protein
MDKTDTQPVPAAVEEALARLGTEEETLNVLGDAQATETVGKWLAERVREAHGAVDVVVVWDMPGPAVLGHVVSRELDARVVRAFEIEGLVELADRVGEGRRTLALGDHFPTENSVNALVGVARNCGLDVVAIAAALGSDALTSSASAPTVVPGPTRS